MGYDLPNIANQFAIGQDQTSQTCMAPKGLFSPLLALSKMAKADPSLCFLLARVCSQISELQDWVTAESLHDVLPDMAIPAPWPHPELPNLLPL